MFNNLRKMYKMRCQACGTQLTVKYILTVKVDDMRHEEKITILLYTRSNEAITYPT